MKRSFILYSALTALTPSHFRVCAWNRKKPFDAQFIYVRAELVNCHYNDAIFKSKPMDGETFLNCVPAE